MSCSDSRRMSYTLYFQVVLVLCFLTSCNRLDREDISYDAYNSMTGLDGQQELSNNETEAWSPDDVGSLFAAVLRLTMSQLLEESSEGNEVLLYQDYEAVMDNMCNLVGYVMSESWDLSADKLAAPTASRRYFSRAISREVEDEVELCILAKHMLSCIIIQVF